MEGLQRWVLLLCCGAILYGVVENLLPQQGVFPVIKTVAVLYIILILLSPSRLLKKTEQTVIALPQTEQLQQEEASQELFLQKTADVLCEKLAEALRTRESGVQVVSVQLESTGEELQSVTVRLRGDEQVEKNTVQQLCDSLLGMEGAYEWETG